jgi:hypothetical protein
MTLWASSVSWFRLHFLLWLTFLIASDVLRVVETSTFFDANVQRARARRIRAALLSS